MDFYLDIDGVILANTNRAANFADDFLQFILTHFPDSTYWLTTHQWRGEDRTMQLLKPVLRPETRKLMPRIKQTSWYELKTDAIDFGRPFRWYDDDLFPEERKVLDTFDATNSWVQIDLQKDPNQLLDEIAYLKQLFGII